MKCVFVVAAVMALVCVANAQCPLSAADVRPLDFSEVATVCNRVGNPASTEDCDECQAALFKAFIPVGDKFGFDCEEVAAQAGGDAGALTQDATAQLTPCISVVLPALNAAGVRTASLLSLRACPTEAGPKTTQAFSERCPNVDVNGSD